MELIRTHRNVTLIKTCELWGRCAGCKWSKQTFYIEGNAKSRSRAEGSLVEAHDTRNICASRITFSEQGFSVH